MYHISHSIVGKNLFYWNGQDFVLMENYCSRYSEFEKLFKADAAKTKKKFKREFSRIEISDIIRSDNGSQYSPRKFIKFAKDWGF